MPIGFDDVLQRLAAADNEVDGYVWEADGKVFVVITDPAATRLVACMVGRDRRVVEPKSSDSP